jgi:PAS domain S-box-containing protein
MKKKFTSGIKALDEYLVSLETGDVFLAFISSKRPWNVLVSSFVKEVQEHNFPISYISVTGEFSPFLNDVKHVRIYNLQEAKKSSQFIVRGILRFISTITKNSCLLLDDLSTWKQLLGNERRVVELYQKIVGVAIKRDIVVISSAQRSEFSLETLAKLKDGSTIAVEVVQRDKYCYIVPLAMKNRYSPSHVSPLRLNANTLFFSGPLKKDEETILPLEYPADIYSDFFQECPEPLMLFELNSNVWETNKSLADLFGYTRVGLLAKSPLSFVTPNAKVRALRFLLELSRRKRATIMLEALNKHGKIIDVEVSVTNLGNKKFIGTVKDISRLKALDDRISQIENEFQGFLEHNSVAILVIQNNKTVFANKAFQGLLGFGSIKEILDKRIRELLTPSSSKLVSAFLNDERECPPQTEIQLVRKDGVIIDSLISVSSLQYNSKLSHVLSFADVTSKSELVRKLSASEERLREIVSHAGEAIAVLVSGRILLANQKFASLFECESEDKMMEIAFLELVREGDKARVSEHLNRVESRKYLGNRIEFVGLTKDGNELEIELNASVVQASFAKQIVVICRNISEQKQLLNTLKEQVEEVERVDTLVAKVVSDDVKKILQHTLHELLQLHKWEYGVSYLMNPKTKEFELQVGKATPHVLSEKLLTLACEHGIGALLSKTHESYFFPLKKYPSYLPHRSVFEKAGFGSVGFIPMIAQEECIGFFVVGTKSKIFSLPFSQQFYRLLSVRIGSLLRNLFMLSQVKELEEQFRTLSEVNSLITYRLAPNGTVLYVSSAVEQCLGYKPKEFYRNSSLWLSLVHPDDKKLLLDRITNLSGYGNRISLEYRIRPKGKASYRWVTDELNIIRDAENEDIRLFGFVNDTTETKVTIEEMKTKATFDGNLLSSMYEGIVVFNNHLHCTYWNRGMSELTGVDAADAIGKHVTELFPPELNEERLSLVRLAFSGNEKISDTLVLKTHRNKTLTMWEHYTPLRNADGEIYGVVGMLRDVTSEKKLEHKLRDSEQLLSNLIDTMDDILLVTDLKGSVLQVNRAFLNVMGYKRNQVIGLEFPYPWLLDEEMGRYVLWISSLREKSSLHDFDMTWKAKDGRHYWISMSTALLRNSLGEPIALLNLARDITERKRLTKQLEERNRLVELINRINEVANQANDFNTIFSQFSEEISTILQFDDLNFALLDERNQAITIYEGKGISGSYLGRNIPLDVTVSKLAITSRQPILIQDLQEQQYQSLVSYAEGIRSQMSIPILVKDRVLGTLNMGSMNPHRYSEEDAQFLHSVAQQLGVIYDRVVLFKQVTDDATYIHNLLDSIDNVVYTVDSKRHILEVNKAWHEFVRSCGISEHRDYHGVNLLDALPDETLKILLENVVDDLLKGTVRFFSQEYVFEKGPRREVYQVTINPMLHGQTITGLVISHTDITPLKQTELQLTKHNEQLLTLHEISMLIRSTLNFNEVLDLAIPLLKKNVDAQAILVYQLNQQENILNLVKQIGFEHVPETLIATITVFGSATGMVVKNQEALFIDESSYRDERILPDRRELLKKEKVESLAIIPLLVKGNVLGAMCVFYSQPHVLTPHLRNILSLVGNQLGTSLENARLYGELQSQVSRLTVLYELSERLTSTLEVDTICRIVLENTLRVVPYRKAVITLYERERESFDATFVAEVSDDGTWGVEKTHQPPKIDLGSIVDLTMKRRTSLTDVEHSKIYVPLFSKDSMIGMMILESLINERYTSIHIRMIESISNLSALALEKAELYEETIEKSLEIERRNKELDDFTYVVSHDLKEPLISVEGFSKILLADYGDIIQVEGKEYLGSMVGATERMKKLIDDLLMLSRVSRPAESFKPVRLQHILQDIKHDLEFRLSNKNAEVIIREGLPMVYGNETLLKIVFGNLISNAVKFNDKPCPRVEVGLQNTENNMYLFYVKDNGIGISKEFHEKIFMIFQRLHRREEYEGTGAGLAIVKKIIELHKGKIWVESELGNGSSFYISIPTMQLEN